MKVLIVGGTGLISTAITDQLVARGDDVTVFNRGVTERRIKKDVVTLHGDRWDYSAFERGFERSSYDTVIDMVAYQPEDAHSIVRAFWGRAKQVVVCSTVCAYGGPLTKLPATADEPHRFVTEYGRKKSAIEGILMENDGRQGTRATILRPSYTTGEGATASGVLFDDSTPERIRRGLPVIVHGDGKTKWATAHVVRRRARLRQQPAERAGFRPSVSPDLGRAHDLERRFRGAGEGSGKAAGCRAHPG